MISYLVSLAAKEESLLDKIGLGSLEKIPWEAFPIALILSALIGAAGGLIYAGLVGPGGEERKKKP